MPAPLPNAVFLTILPPEMPISVYEPWAQIPPPFPFAVLSPIRPPYILNETVLLSKYIPPPSDDALFPEISAFPEIVKELFWRK